MDNDTGWIKIHRKFVRWEWAQDPHMVALWIDLLLNANFRETHWRGHTVLRGQLIVGRSKLAKRTGISEQSIRTCLDRLKSTGEITIHSTSRFSIITICKYNDYQQDDRIGQPASSPAFQQTSNQQSTSNQPHPKNVKNVKNEKNINTPPCGDPPLPGFADPLDSEPEAPPKKLRPEKLQHGTYKHVHLTAAEHADWRSRVGDSVLSRMIEKLDSWIEAESSNPKGFLKRKGNGKNAAACFRSWVHRAVCDERAGSRKTGSLNDESEQARLRNKRSMVLFEESLQTEAEDPYEETIRFLSGSK